MEMTQKASIPRQTQAQGPSEAGSLQSCSSQGGKAWTALSPQHLMLIALPTDPSDQHLASGYQTACLKSPSSPATACLREAHFQQWRAAALTPLSQGPGLKRNRCVHMHLTSCNGSDNYVNDSKEAPHTGQHSPSSIHM